MCPVEEIADKVRVTSTMYGNVEWKDMCMLYASDPPSFLKVLRGGEASVEV
jgi:hypothetical protein